VRVDVGIMYWGLGATYEEQSEIARVAEQLGYERIWVAEGYGSDAASILGWLTAQTASIGIGSAMFQVPARSPAMTAMTGATLDVLSGGRMRLGLGSSGPQVAEGWHGVAFGRSLQAMREYVDIVRLVVRRERLAYEGSVYRVPFEGRTMRPLKLSITPVQEDIPIYLGTMGPRGCALAAEIADGWMPMFLSPAHYLNQFLPYLREGASRSGRKLDDLDINPTMQLCISADIDQARDMLRPLLALYVGGMGTRKQNFYHRLVTQYGFGEAADEVQDLFLSGQRDAAERALPAELIDAVSLCGPEDVIADRLRQFEAVGINHLTVTPALGVHGIDRISQLRRLAAVARLQPTGNTGDGQLSGPLDVIAD
jgi:F420-dependent oxidoreductase-like protein